MTPTTTDGMALAQDLHAQGVAANSSGRPADGARLLRAALAGLAATSDADALRGRILLSLAHAEAEQGRVEEGLRLLDEAQSILPPAEQNVVYGQRGLFLVRTGRSAQALALLDVAVDLLTKAGDPLELARALLNRAVAQMTLGHLHASRADLLACTDLARSGGDAFESVEVKAIQNLAFLDFLAGNLPDALAGLDAAARRCTGKLRSYLPSIVLDKARFLLAAGLAEEADRELAGVLTAFRRYRLTEDYAEAELARAEAALLADRPRSAVRHAGTARRRFARRSNETWADLAALTALRARFADGSAPLPLARRGTELAPRLARLGLVDDARTAEVLVARALIRAGRVDEATRVAAGVRRPRSGEPLSLRLLWSITQAELAVAQGRPAKQHQHLRAGLTWLQQHRSHLGSLDLQTGAAVHGRDLAAAAIRAALADGRPATVFAWAERVRAQAFRLMPVRPPSDQEAATALEELRHLHYALRDAELNRLPATHLRARRTELERTVRERAWFHSGPGASRPVACLRDAHEGLAQAAMVVYLRDRDSLSALVLAGGSTSLLPLGRYPPVQEQVLRLHADLNALASRAMPARLAEAVLESSRCDAQALADTLITPLLPILRDRALVLVPTGILHTVPWLQLPACRGRPVTVAASATAWLSARRRLAVAGGGSGSTGVLLVAGPGIDHGDREVRSIAEAQPEAVCLTGSAATPEATLRALDGSPLAHIAAHGHHEPFNPLFSRLELHGGTLMGYDLQRLQRPPRHIVLSACDVGLANIRLGDEILGVAAALLCTGSSTVVASVARVPDHAVPDIMIPYHRALAAGVSPARALAEASAAAPLAPFVCLGAA